MTRGSEILRRRHRRHHHIALLQRQLVTTQEKERLTNRFLILGDLGPQLLNVYALIRDYMHSIVLLPVSYARHHRHLQLDVRTHALSEKLGGEILT